MNGGDPIATRPCPACQAGAVHPPLRLGRHVTRCVICGRRAVAVVSYGGAFGGLHVEVHEPGRPPR